MRADHVAIALATLLVIPLYFLLAGEVSVGEAVACAPVAVIASLYAIAQARSGTVELQVSSRGIVSLLRGFGAVVPDMWRVARGLFLAIWRRPEAMQGVIANVPFRFGGAGPDDVGRRATVVVAISLAPNGFAVGMDHERDELLVHQLLPAPIGGDREWPQ